MPCNPDCRACPLWERARTVCLWGENRDRLGWKHEGPADVMIVGEAPGGQEDAEGRPFIGPSGALLAQHLPLTDFYITNTVKCFPGGTPTTTQVKACKGYLDEEIQTVRPKYILALGNTAYHHFGQGAITQNAGREFYSKKYEAWVMPALHPAAVLRDPTKEAAWALDLARFVRLTRGELVDTPPVTVHIARTWADLDALRRGLETADGFTFDFEATPIEWWYKGWKAISVAFCWKEGEATVVPLYHPESPFIDQEVFIHDFFAYMRKVMQDPKRKATAHNMLYDDLAWYRCSGYLPYTTFDTMVAAQILDENQPKGLKWQGRAKLGWPQWDIDIRDAFDDLDHYDREKTREQRIRAAEKQGYSTLDGRWVIKQPLDAIATYNGYDAAATYLLRRTLLDDLANDARLLRYFVRLEMPKLRALERLIAGGISVDASTLAARVHEAEVRLVDAAMAIPVENPGSTRQIQDWLYEELKLPVHKLTPANKPSTDEETIKVLAREHPEARTVLEYRKWQKYLSTYLRPLADSLKQSFDGRIHPEYRSTSVETGRLASSFHTTPRDGFIRSVYSAPDGWSLVQGDYAQIEARLAAWAAAGKPTTTTVASDTMLAAFLARRDVYVETAARALHKKPEEVNTDKSNPNNERQIMGKVPTLASLYRISPRGLREYVWREAEIDWTMGQATQVWAAFNDRWPEFPIWHAREERYLRAKGWTESAIGRRRRLPGAQSGDDKTVHESVNAGINAPIQSLASDITQTAMILLDRLIRERNLEWMRVVGNVHDALLVEIRDDHLSSGIRLLRASMLRAPAALLRLGLRLPDGLIDVELSRGPWGNGEKV